MSHSETHEGAHDSHYHAACEGNNEDALHNEQLSQSLTILSECVLFAIFGIEVDRLIHLACVTIVTEPANGCHDRSSDGCGADASEAADAGHHRWREEQAECDADKEASIDHVGDGRELESLGPFGARIGIGTEEEDSTARIVGENGGLRIEIFHCVIQRGSSTVEVHIADRNAHSDGDGRKEAEARCGSRGSLTSHTDFLF